MENSWRISQGLFRRAAVTFSGAGEKALRVSVIDNVTAAHSSPSDRGEQQKATQITERLCTMKRKIELTAVCLFNHQDGKKKEGLAIVLVQDEKSKQTDIFCARIDLTESEASPSP